MSLTLAALEQGEGPPVVLLHGLFGSARNLSGIARTLAAAGYRTVALDLRNHGASPWSDVMTYEAMAEDVVAAITSRGLGPVRLIGHSMGGKVAMTLALTRPELVERLVPADIAPVAYRHDLLDYVLAMKAVDLSRLERRAQADELLAAAVPDAGVRGFLLLNLVQEDGRFRWRINLDALDEGMAAVTGFPDFTGRVYDGPTLFIAGGKSDYIRPAHHGAIRALFPRAEFATIPNAGHWLHAEQPQEFLRLTMAFFSATSSATR